MAGDVIGHRQQLAVHQVARPGDHGIATRVARAREPRDERGEGERALELAHAADDVGGGGLFRGRLLCGGGDGGEGQERERGYGKGKAHRSPPGG